MRKSATVENLFEHSVKSFDTWQRTEVGQNVRSLVSARFHYYELQNFSSLRLAPLRIRQTSFTWGEVLLPSASLPLFLLFFPSVWHTQLRQCLSLVACTQHPKAPKCYSLQALSWEGQTWNPSTNVTSTGVNMSLEASKPAGQDLQFHHMTAHWIIELSS